ncbi:MAG: hypothetical protein IJR99_00035 [Kiritimatiellae bacterium]|nr:hypothetical protein [Kiritimatiellia bacterium]
MKKRNLFWVMWMAAAALTAQTTPTPQKPAEPAMRTWTSVNGNEVEGAFLKEEDGKIFLRRPDGKVISTKRSKLSPNDLAWIDARGKKPGAVETFTFPLATLLETNHMEHYRKIRRIIVETLTKLRNNDRADKRMAFIVRDATVQYGWASITPDFYLDERGKVGKVKKLSFTPIEPIPLREAVQMVRDKFVLPYSGPMTVRRTRIGAEPCWEVLQPPAYVSKIYLMEENHDGEKSLISSFDLTFPPPEE